MIITEVKSKNLSLYKDSDLLILPTMFSTVKSVSFSISEIKELCKKYDNLCLKVDKIFLEDDIKPLTSFIEGVKDLNIKYYI